MEEQPNKRPSWFRRKFLINEHFQLHFIGFAAIVSLSACVFFYVASSYFFIRYHEFAVEVGLRPSDPFFRVLYNMEMMLTNIFVGTSVAVVVVSVVGGLIFSHRVAGPMYRMRKHLEAVSRGETWSNVTFRSNDYFVDVADAYNMQMQYVRQKLGIDATVVETTVETSVEATNGDVNFQTPVDVASSENVAESKSPESEDVKKAS